MAAASYNFSIEQGSDLEVNFQYIDENNTFVNLTNHYILLKFITDSGQIYSFDNITDSSDYKMTTDSFGKIRLNIPARITNTYNFNEAVYDLDIREPNEQYPGSGLKRYRFVQGVISIIKRNIPAIIDDNFAGDFNTVADSCGIDCSAINFDAVIYSGSGLTIKDNHHSVSKISIQDTRTINYVELSINGLNHTSHQDLSIFLAPPSGDKILVFSHHKINNYQPGFSCVFSDRALPDSSVHSVISGGMCRIIDKTNSIRFDNSIPMTVCDQSGCSEIINNEESVGLNNENLLSSMDHLRGYIPISGDWSLHVIDNDIGGSGTLNSWKLIVTYIDME